jgi:hypothetical protein
MDPFQERGWPSVTSRTRSPEAIFDYNWFPLLGLQTQIAWIALFVIITPK